MFVVKEKTYLNRFNVGSRPGLTANCGYTMIELLTVISLIAIFASLVVVIPFDLIVSSQDQEKADDVNSIARQLEQSYNTQVLGTPSYPSTLELLSDISSRTRSMKSIEVEALRAPGSTSESSIVAATSTSTSNPVTGGVDSTSYVYQPITRSGTLCNAADSTAAVADNCVRFVIYYYNASNKRVEKITSLRQQ